MTGELKPPRAALAATRTTRRRWRQVQDTGLLEAMVYDVLLLACAERIYTFNLGAFRSLSSVDLQARICSP